MLCSYCGGATKISDTGTVSSLSRQYLVEAVKNIAHIDEDLRVRKRICKVCKKKDLTVEITLSEINHLYRIAVKAVGKKEMLEILEKRKAYNRERKSRKRS